MEREDCRVPFISQSTRVSASPDESPGLPDKRRGRSWNGPPERPPARRGCSTKRASRENEGNGPASGGTQTRLPPPPAVFARRLDGVACRQGVSVRKVRPRVGLPSH